ncbi:MAG: FAD-binding protein [Collinsella sp.]|nr:FAD-binding protein [Collinsella sp.]
MIEISDMAMDLDTGGSPAACERSARAEASRILGCKGGDIAEVTLHRRSIDARKRRDVHFTVTVRVVLADGLDERAVLESVDEPDRRRVHIVDDEAVSFPRPLGAPSPSSLRPIVVGAGCAGLFAALALAEAGLEPLLVERGSDAERRAKRIERFEATGELDPDDNIQFGLGGAGTFSDGKLNTGTKNPSHRLVLETMVEGGAPREILWDAKPHVGSDLLPRVVTHMVERIRERGGEVRFSCRLVDIDRDAGGGVRSVTLLREGREERIPCSHLILACGHSARDVFSLLQRRGFELARKTFAMGVRIEHLQADIDRAQYGPSAGHPALGAAPYKLVAHLPNDRSLFSFCMCPGGQVVAAASEEGGVVTNGASLHARDGVNANAALLVNVTPQDLPGDDPLAGIELQRECERRAFELGGGGYRAPAQLVGDYLIGIPSTCGGDIEPTYPLGVTWGAVGLALPFHVDETLRIGIPVLARRLRGFDRADAVLTGVETRSSSPVTVLRDKGCRALGAEGLYPCGEGAGYAGGIMSAATDGIRCARAVIADLARP